MNLEDYIVQKNTSIIEAIKKIDMNQRGIVFICDNNILLGTVTDGDIRRYILKYGNFERSILEVANRNPIYTKVGQVIDYQLFMKQQGITALPVLDDNGTLLNVVFLKKFKSFIGKALNIPVVIMAGGKGTRLLPYTNILPKPLIPIGEKTITEHIMEHFENYGCKQFYMIINFKKNFIKAYFEDNEDKREINFIEEKEFLGTGGGLSLLKDKVNQSFFMTNCDIIVDIDYSDLMNYHNKHHNIITMVCAKKKVIIPYGIVKCDTQNKRIKLEEKPEYKFDTNTGLYVIDPAFLEFISANTFVHITEVIQKCIAIGKSVGVYSIDEDLWMDMGQLEELEKMKTKLLE